MFIKPTKEAKGIVFDISEDVMMEAMLYPTTEEVPCPWDADIEVSEGKVILTGRLGPGGPRAFCRCECSIEDFPKYYKVELPEQMDGYEEAIVACEAAGWVEA